MARKPHYVMARVRTLFAKSGLSLDDLGRRMGYGKTTARKSAWQFLNKTADPRLSMLDRFAEALSVTLADIVKTPTKSDRHEQL
jgi:transcriptional regulator with XRE-family HTH domain